MITQSELKKILNYNPDTGIFTKVLKNGTIQRRGFSYARVYIGITINRKTYLAHRLAWLYMTGEFPKYMTDHINGNTEDNSFSNLREST